MDYTITSSAFTQARKKLSHTAFIELNADTVATYYEDSKETRKFFGYRCIAGDSSDIILPNIEEIRMEFGSSKIKNQSGKDLGKYAHAKCFCYYDVLNDIAVKTSLSHCKSYEVDTAIEMLDYFNSGDLLIYDRGFASYMMLCSLIKRNKNYIIRFPSKSFKQLESMFRKLGSWSKEIKLEVPKDQKKKIKSLSLPETIKVRFVRVILSNGEVEILATSITDKNIKREDFKRLYWLRWGVETFFSKLKSRLSLENFTGKTAESVKQDFWSSVLISNLETIMTQDTNNDLEASSQNNIYKKQVNKSVSFNTIKNCAFELFYSDSDEDIILSKLTLLFKTNTVLQRPNKTTARVEISPRRSLSYQKRRKKHVF